MVAVAAVALILYAGLNRPGRSPRVVRGDGEGYYAYVTAYVVDGDPSFRTLVRRRFANDESLRLSGLRYEPRTGRYLDKYSPGVAMLTLPFFLAGHGLATFEGRADGYSGTEQFSSGLAAIACGFAGLAALRRLLLRWYSDAATAATLVCIGLGTGLLNYLAFDSSYSHAFSFAAVALTLLAVIRWLERPESWRRAVEGGLAVGLVVCIRPANIVAVVPAVAFGVVGWPTIRSRVLILSHHWARILLGAAVAAPFVLVSLLAWRAASGRLLLFSYQGEQFSFLQPKWQVLSSFRPHGLLPYAPVLALAVLGMVPLWRRHRSWFWPVTLGLFLQTYLLASWREWPLGGGFGHRGYVDVNALLAVPLAAFFAAIRPGRWRWAAGAFATVAVVTTVLGTLAYWQGRLPPDGASPGSYLDAILGGEASASERAIGAGAAAGSLAANGG